eukprot:gene10838-biopygen10858
MSTKGSDRGSIQAFAQHSDSPDKLYVLHCKQGETTIDTDTYLMIEVSFVNGINQTNHHRPGAAMHRAMDRGFRGSPGRPL